MTTPVNSEIAKLLKEKGFDEPVNYYFADNGRKEHFQEKYKANYNSSVSVGLTLSRPTIAEVVMWLYEKHGIWIYVNEEHRPYIIKEGKNLNYQGKVFRIENENYKYSWILPTEAYEAAIEYVLTNLI